MKNELESEGWELISPEYHSLKSLLELRCPKGHLTNSTLDYWRRHKTECPICKESQYCHVEMNVPFRNGVRVFAVD
ncbi:MAG: hypothetical protein LUC37_04095 [Prevotella sp.]|nr:hypothetical protein [Prevotella sp.]